MVLQYELQRTINCTYDDNIYIPRSISFSPSGRYIAAAMGTWVCVWDCATGDKEYEIPYEAKALSVAWTHEKQLISGFSDGMLLTATLDTEQERDANIAHTLVGFDPLNSPIEFIAIHHSHSSIAIGGDDVIQIWKPTDNGYIKHVATIPPPPAASRGKVKVKVTSIGWVNHDTIVVSYLNNGILVWNLQSNSLVHPRSELPARNQCPRGFVAPDGCHFVALNKANAFHLYHIDSGIFLHSFQPENDGNSSSHPPAAFIHTGGALAGAAGSKVFLWDVKTFLSFHEPLSVPTGRLLHLLGEFIPSSNQFLIAGSTSTGQLNIWKSRQVVPKSFSYSSRSRNRRTSPNTYRYYVVVAAAIVLVLIKFFYNQSASVYI
ncbi:hypothetical protein PLEOSDRAFT_162073 [Pleurotus ostreatus PC15]|uniref:Anaphase-promoting complex subunit 4 WD40 domain-containing protein n=1 Tax=Pleurotus ostreatus (strain PC15) TaxID=1137138 RepID=A0A067NAG3_PLEO1|nr:hypothetical protein PLEOSDRAFT_162073 [Pleurotus ostreatus PC15]